VDGLDAYDLGTRLHVRGYWGECENCVELCIEAEEIIECEDDRIFAGCGTVVVDELYYCYLFEADADGKRYDVDGLDYYSPGTRLFVRGEVHDDCVSFCNVDLCIDAVEITPCDSNYFVGCGRVELDPYYYCYVFHPFSGGAYLVPGIEQHYQPGQIAYVRGTIYDCISFCTADGCIDADVISGCYYGMDGPGAPAGQTEPGQKPVFSAADLIGLIEAFGPCPERGGCAFDLTGDGVVGNDDMLMMLLTLQQ
jgi:hypothetical protein